MNEIQRDRLTRLNVLMDELFFMDDPIAIDIYVKAEMAVEKEPFTGYIKLTNKEKFFLIDKVLVGNEFLDKRDRAIIESFCNLTQKG